MRTPLLLIALAACRIPADDTGVDPDLIDADGDGFPAVVDCDEGSAAIFPGADETCDGIDEDCDGVIDDRAIDGTVWYADVDGDGFGDSGSVQEACDQPFGTVANADDCNDASDAFYPGADEVDCQDPNDYNCDGSIGFEDGDNDGRPACQDCDDTDADVYPDAIEVCDGDTDENCDGDIDEPGAYGEQIFYTDGDGDGFGNPDAPSWACDQPSGAVTDNGDCNDASAAAFPGNAEVCDGLDNDCDGGTDVDASDADTWYVDGDGDGYGSSGISQIDCAQPSGFVANSDDCDDGALETFPGAGELCDGADNNCDSTIDEGYDNDGDTFTSCGGDCNDLDADIHPLADETCNGKDDNCNGADDEDAVDETAWYADADGDGFGATVSTDACEQPVGFVATSTDCDDSDNQSNPSASEICDGVDNNCDAAVDEGFDGDGDGVSACAGDCDDGDNGIFPGAGETCDGVDEDCDGGIDEGASDFTTFYLDHDGDGFGDAGWPFDACAAPANYVVDDTDCDDDDTAFSPGAPLGCDGLDYDCDGTMDNDADGDLYPDVLCGGTDCNDGDPLILPEPSGGCALGTDCNDILTSGAASVDGSYTIDPDGFGVGIAPMDVYCDMGAFGGGWTLLMKFPAGSGSQVTTNNALGAKPCLTSSGDCRLSTAEISAILQKPGVHVTRVQPDNPLYLSWYQRSDSPSNVWPSNLECNNRTNLLNNTNTAWIVTSYQTAADAANDVGADIGTYTGAVHYYPTPYSNEQMFFSVSNVGLRANDGWDGNSYVGNQAGSLWVR